MIATISSRYSLIGLVDRLQGRTPWAAIRLYTLRTLNIVQMRERNVAIWRAFTNAHHQHPRLRPLPSALSIFELALHPPSYLHSARSLAL